MMKLFRLALFLFFTHISLFVFSQQSKNIQTINGKKYFIHKVEKGQSLYGIAKIYGLDLNALLVENPEAIDGIKAGQDLKVPAEKPKEQTQPTLKDYENYITHKVAKGETVYNICKKYQVTEQQLTQLNPDLKNGLKENAVLKVKAKEKAVSTTTLTTTNVKTNTISTTEETVAKEEDNTPPIEVNKVKKNNYTVGLFLPFSFSTEINIDELVTNKQDFPITQQLALDMYEGLKQAADSLKSDNFSIDFKLYDSREIDSSSLTNLIQTNEFKNLDLIIGPLYNSPFKTVSIEAKKYQIPCVSPLTQQNKVLFDNPFTSKVIASNNTILEGLAKFCADSISKQQVVLVNSGNVRDAQNISAFKGYYNQKVKDTLTEVRGVTGAKAAYKSEKTTYYIVPVENEVFITDFLTQLNVFSDKKENICVIGLRRWLNYDNLDLEYFNKFNFTYPTTYYIDSENSFTKKLNANYIQKYNTNAEDYYYIAADLGLYYFSLLKQVGSAFSVVLDDMPQKGNFLNFDFTHPNNNTGFENKAIHIIRYSDYSLKKVN